MANAKQADTEHDYAVKLGKRIQAARKKAGITSQEELGKRLYVNRATINEWEKGEVNMKIVDLKRVAKELDVSETWLFSGEGNMEAIVTVRDCCKMFFHDLPAFFDCTWSMSDSESPRGSFNNEYLPFAPPTLTYQLILPTEDIYGKDGYLTGRIRVKDKYRPFLTCAEHAQQLENTRESYPQYFHEEDYTKLFASIPNAPLADDDDEIPF